jgi:hypothetical protein
MPTTSPHPIAEPPLGILNLQPTLYLAPAGTRRRLPADLPPLHFLSLADWLGELHEMVFPDRPEWLQQEAVDWTDEEDVAAAVERFLGCVNTLFPVHEEVWDADLEAIEWRLYEIPVLPMGYNLWHDSWEDLQEPAPYLLHMSCAHMQHSRDVENRPYGRDTFAGLYPDHQVPRELEPQQLVDALCQTCDEEGRSTRLPQPERIALPDLIQMLDQSTGNVWLDMGEISLAEGGGYPEWSQENVDWLAEEWRKARPMLDGILSLLNWKNENAGAIAEKLSAVRDALVTAHGRRPHHDPADATATPPA